MAGGSGAACAVLAAVLWGAGAPNPQEQSLGGGGSEAVAPVKLEPFRGLLEPRAAMERVTAGGNAAGRIVAGTPGLNPPVPPPLRTQGGATIAILGDLAPMNGAGDKYTKMAVGELNLLRPDLVLTVGGLVPGMTRDGAKYVEQVRAVRGVLDGLLMPWYPCAGETDIFSGTRQGEDRRFEGLYQRYMGPLYYSIDAGDIHAIVLDSEERIDGGGTGISEAQVQWMKEDLNHVFEGAGGGGGKRARWVVVTVNRPLWRLGGDVGRAGNWSRVHDELVRFNRRPIVSVEGVGGGSGAEARGPRVMAVFGGNERAYAMEPVRDGIHYYVLGPTGAAPKWGEDAAAAVRQMMLVKFDSPDAAGPEGMQPAVVTLGGAGTGGQGDAAIVGEEIMTAKDRAMADAIAGWGNDVMGINGVIDERTHEAGQGANGVAGIMPKEGLRLVLNNPLGQPVDIALRMASAGNLAAPWRREEANTFVEGLDLPWELSTAHTLRHLQPGGKDGWAIELTREGEMATIGGPPQVEIVVHWSDSRSQTREVVLKRRVPVASRVEVPVAAAVSDEASGTEGWENAASGSAYAWEIRGDEPRKLTPNWQMTADAERLYVRVRVDDAVHSFWPGMALDGKWGGLASDAVSIAWARGIGAAAESVQRIWVVPFGPAGAAGSAGGAEVWTNRGVGEKQTALMRVDPKWGIKGSVAETRGGYEVMVSLPRGLIFGEGGGPTVAAVMNIAVHDNDGAARTWVRSWAKEELGPGGWGLVALTVPPATRPVGGGGVGISH